MTSTTDAPSQANILQVLFKWSDCRTNNKVLRRAAAPSVYTLLQQRRLRWLAHVYGMQDARIHKDLLYGELVTGKRAQGRPQLRLKDVCKRVMKALDLYAPIWKTLPENVSRRRQALNSQPAQMGRELIKLQPASEKTNESRVRRKNSEKAPPAEGKRIKLQLA